MSREQRLLYKLGCTSESTMDPGPRLGLPTVPYTGSAVQRRQEDGRIEEVTRPYTGSIQVADGSGRVKTRPCTAGRVTKKSVTALAEGIQIIIIIKNKNINRLVFERQYLEQNDETHWTSSSATILAKAVLQNHEASDCAGF